jgi:hypothetical protein
MIVLVVGVLSISDIAIRSDFAVAIVACRGSV